MWISNKKTLIGNQQNFFTSHKVSERIKSIAIKSIPYLGLITIIILFSILTKGNLLSIGNLKLIFRQSLVLLMASVAGVFVISTGNLDFAMGAESRRRTNLKSALSVWPMEDL